MTHLRQHARQRIAADRIDAGCPALALQGTLGRFGEGRAVHHRGSTQALEIIMRVRTAAGCHGLVAPMREDGGSHRTHASGRARDQHFARVARESMCFKRHDRQHRGESRGTDRHGVVRRETGGQRHQPVAVDDGLLRQATPLRLAHAPSREYDLVAHAIAGVAALTNRAREVDAGNVRVGLHQAADATDDHAVLEVDGRVFDRHRDIAGREPRFLHRNHGARHGTVRIFQQQCLEHASAPPDFRLMHDRC